MDDEPVDAADRTPDGTPRAATDPGDAVDTPGASDAADADSLDAADADSLDAADADSLDAADADSLDEPIEPESVNPEHAAFVLLGVALTLVVVVSVL